MVPSSALDKMLENPKLPAPLLPGRLGGGALESSSFAFTQDQVQNLFLQSTEGTLAPRGLHIEPVDREIIIPRPNHHTLTRGTFVSWWFAYKSERRVVCVLRRIFLDVHCLWYSRVRLLPLTISGAEVIAQGNLCFHSCRICFEKHQAGIPL